MAKEDEQKPGQKQLEGEPKFNQQQYDLLKRCSENKDITEWNEWRKGYPETHIHLEDAFLSGFHLEGAFLNKAVVTGNREEKYTFPRKAGMKYLVIPKDEEVEDSESDVNLARADFRGAYLKGALFYGTHLEGADFSDAHLEGTDFWHTYLADAQFHTSIVDGSTVVWKCKVSRGTNFDGVGLDSACIDAGIKQLLEYNIRRMNWEEWYKVNPKMKWLVKPFWEMSDYGISTKRVIVTFFKWAMVFAVIYYILGAFDYYLIGVKDYPGPIADLFVDEGGPISWCLVPLRSIYFSVVTMTTLGFGDMHANPHNPWWSGIGHLLLMLQVLLGYVLLGALITRFAVLFTAGGPAGKFSPTKTKEKKDDKNQKT